MMRNDQNVIGTGGQFSRGTVSRPAIGASSECFRISEPSLGISTAYLTLPAAWFGQAEQDQRRAVLVALEMAFHRHDLDRLMLQRVEAVLVAGEDLDRRHQRRHPHRHREHHAGAGEMLVAQQMTGADRADHQRRGEIGRQHHVHEAVGKRRIEDHLEPVGGDELAVGIDGVAGRASASRNWPRGSRTPRSACRSRPSGSPGNAVLGRRARGRTASRRGSRPRGRTRSAPHRPSAGRSPGPVLSENTDQLVPNW